MIKTLALTAALLVSGAAKAADQIAIAVTSDVPGAAGTLTNSMNFSQGDMALFIGYLKANFVCMPVAPATTCTALTLPQVFAAWTASLERQTATQVNQWQLNNAAAAAANAVTPIAPN